MSNLDEMLARMGSAPLPPRLAMMDEAVFAGLTEHHRSSATSSLHSLSIAAIAALAFGVFSTSLPGSPAAAAPSVTPFGAPPALAPSSLLLAAR
jgi:hypothetical protein